MPTYTSWNQSDIGGLNDNLIAAIAAGPSGTARTPSFTSVGVGAGNVAAGAKWITILTSDDFTGTIGGTAATNSWSYTYPPMGADTYGVLAYNVTAGSIIILKAV